MTAFVSRTRAIPLHVQIRQLVQAQVESGQVGPGDQLPSEHEYAAQFGVSLAPVRQALADLVAAGLLVRMKGRGTFVRGARLEEEFDLLRSFTDNLRERGVPFSLTVLERTLGPAPSAIAAELGVSPKTQIVHLRRLATISDEPSVILESYLPAAKFRRLVTVAGLDGGGSLWATLETEFGVRIGQSKSTVELTHLDDDRAELLDEPPGTPALLLRSIMRDIDGAIVEVSRTTYRADRFRFTVTSHRQPPGR